jgi:hypothetical protein
MVINTITPIVAQTNTEAHDFVYLLPSKEIAELVKTCGLRHIL